MYTTVPRTQPTTQQQVFAQLYQIADLDKDGFVGQADAIAFFTQSANIWAQANAQDAKHLDIAQFILSCQLIGLAQSGISPSLVTLGQYLQSGKPIPLPVFRGVTLPSPGTALHTNSAQSSPQVTRGTAPITNPTVEPSKESPEQQFLALDADKDGYVSGREAFHFFKQSGISQEILATIWEMADVGSDGLLDSKEFCLALYLVSSVLAGRKISRQIPLSLLSSLGLQNDCPISNLEVSQDTQIFNSYARNNVIPFETTRVLFANSGLSQEELVHLFNLCDMDKDQQFSLNEFLVVMHLIRQKAQGAALPTFLDPTLQKFISTSTRPTTTNYPATKVTPDTSNQTATQETTLLLLKQRIADLEQQNAELRTAYKEVEYLKDKAEARVNKLLAQLEEMQSNSSKVSLTTATSMHIPNPTQSSNSVLPPPPSQDPASNVAAYLPPMPSSAEEISLPPPPTPISTVVAAPSFDSSFFLPLPPSAPGSLNHRSASPSLPPKAVASNYGSSSLPPPSRSVYSTHVLTNWKESKGAQVNPFLSGWEEDMLPQPTTSFNFNSFTQ